MIRSLAEMIQNWNALMTLQSYTGALFQLLTGPCIQHPIHLTVYLVPIAQHGRYMKNQLRKLHFQFSVASTQAFFAYGQTSSGKTNTMTGITEYAVAHIFDYIEEHKEREFVLKFSALEI
ncbi:hypothetical protein RIF29_06452 [Crotalaria pallida]|uniref:Kinesin motor domain-containing protein n=1 Tax=Crotalaria pallida TaxID=3830 RepID=A0AAN9J4A8_CROPI